MSSMIIVTIFQILIIKCITCSPTVEVGGKVNGTDTKELDINITRVCEELRSLDKALTPMFQDPPEDKGEDMLNYMEKYNQASMQLLSLCKLEMRKVFKAAKDMMDYGGPYFLKEDVYEEKIKDRFKWEQDEMDKVSMLRLKIGENWFDLWNMYKQLPDYDIPTDPTCFE